MDSIIQQLLDIEKNSKLIMEKVEEDKKRLPKLIEEKVSQGVRLIASRERDKIILMRQEIEKETKLKLEKTHSEFEENVLLLKDEYDSNKETWQKEILASILNWR